MARNLIQEAAQWLHRWRHDPLLFVQEAFPWRKTGPLKEEEGPDDWQVDILKRIRDGLTPQDALQIAVTSGHGIGKALSCDEAVPSPQGIVRWGDLSIGDEIFAADGLPTKIIGKQNYQNIPFYRVTFDDGSACDVSSGHLWTVRGRQERRNNLNSWRTVETLDLIRLGVKRSNGSAEARQWEIPIQGAAQFPERSTPVHPYLLGVWLGDGSVNQPRYTKPSTEIADRLRNYGYDVVSSDELHWYIRGISAAFKEHVFGCRSFERYVPAEYKFNSVSNRMALFEGLCDTDGEVQKPAGSIGYSTTSLQLAHDVIWLARSLGCKARMQPTAKIGKYRNDDGEIIECRECWRVTINAPFNPFTLPHKREAFKPSEHRYTCRWIESIEELEPQDGMCVTVDRTDGLYLANDFIVTHNSALVSWIVLWSIGTETDTRGVVTANTENQLRTKTWAELAKWYRLCPLISSLFTLTATSISSSDPAHSKTWRIDQIPWSEKKPEAFAGLHNLGRRTLVVYDEASTIPNVIWETTEGAMTDENTERLWVCFGNPTRNTGRFRECFTGGKFTHRWQSTQVDSRTTRHTNKAQLAQWVTDYGEDSDFVRVRVKGEFPRAGSMQFISRELVDLAQSRARDVNVTLMDPFVIGVDVARFGDDRSVICFRRGRDARTMPWLTFRGIDTMQLAAKIGELSTQLRPDAIFVDGGGVGGGVVDRLRFLRHPVIEVNFGSKADRSAIGQDGAIVYANKRAEMWGTMREWLVSGALPENDGELAADLTGVEYGYTMLAGQGLDAIILEKKEDMKKRGLASPDMGDALALTFAYPVAPTDHTQALRQQPRHQIDYNPFADAWNRR